VELASVREAIKTREQRRADLRARLEHLDGVARMPRIDTTAVRLELNRRLNEWPALLGAEPVKARQIMRKLIEGRLVFTPDADKGMYEFKGNGSYGRLIAGIVGQNVWCPRGDSNTRHAV
jgi:hypothetical protein